MDAEDGDVRGDFFVLKNMGLAVAKIFAGDWLDGGGGGYAVDVQQGGEGHADAYGYGEVGEDGEGEGGEPDGDIGFGEAEDGGDFAPFAHVVGDDEEDGREGGEGDVTGQRRCKQED